MSLRAKGPTLSAFEARFARAQTEWALWVCITSDRKRKPASVFRVRVKHLLEFDRAEPPRRSAPRAGMAFSDYRSEGTGDHSFFSVYDAVFLCLGLRLLDLGFKRKEVVLLLREQREALRRPIGKVIDDRAAGIAAGQKGFEDYDPLEPENRIVLVLPRVETAADYVDDDAEEPVRICFGMPDLLDAVERTMLEKLVLVDVGLAAYTLPSLLLQAPPSQRMRKPRDA